jgi:hypothetical protein
MSGSWQGCPNFRKFLYHEPITVTGVAAHPHGTRNPSTQTARVHLCPAIKRSWAHVGYRLDHTRRL